MTRSGDQTDVERVAVQALAAAMDDLIRAIEIETGETMWSDVLPASGHHFMETPPGDHVIAYALPNR